MVSVEGRAADRTVPLPAELEPYLQAEIEARVPGYIEQVLVARGSSVKRGQLLVVLSAPELVAETAAAESAFHQAEAEASQSEAQVAAVQSTYDRLQEAAKTPGAVAGNELIQQEKQLDGAKSVVLSRNSAGRGAQDLLAEVKAMARYPRVTAPADVKLAAR